MKNVKAVFIDIDNTLLDFDAYVKETMREGFKEFGFIEYDEWMFEVFTRENDKFWRMIENKELTLEELKKIRWNTIFKQLGIEYNGEEFETYFRAKLNDSAILIDGARELLQYLHAKYIVCAASNGPYKQQVKRLEIAGIREYVDYAFISEDVGASKPSERFFDICLERLNENREDKITPDECIMIGDSITSDIVGGINAKMHTILYERGNGKNKGLSVKAEYTVTELNAIREIL